MKKLFKKLRSSLSFAFMQPSALGGQAIIEGVMMRSKKAFAMAVQRKNGEITCKQVPYISLAQRQKVLGLLFVRGFIQLVESLYIGIKALNYSADIAMQDEKGQQEPIQKSWKDSLYSTVTIVISLAIASRK